MQVYRYIYFVLNNYHALILNRFTRHAFAYMIALLHRFHCKETESIDEALALVVEKLKLAKAKKKTGRLKKAYDWF